jgi:hypothetical protein
MGPPKCKGNSSDDSIICDELVPKLGELILHAGLQIEIWIFQIGHWTKGDMSLKVHASFILFPSKCRISTPRVSNFL